MMAAWSQWTAVMRRKSRLAAAAVILQGDAPDGDEAKGDEQASLEVLAQRKETKKKSMSAAGSAPKRKRAEVRKNHPRFPPGVDYLSWPKGSGYSVDDALPDHRRVVWEVQQIYLHLAAIFGELDAATKMNYLTAATSPKGAIKKMKGEWDEGSPPYTSVPCAALKQSLITLWTAKVPSTT